MFAYTGDDVIEVFDAADGKVRVTYSTAGPSQTRMADNDGSGVPDIVEEAADVAVDVMAFYELELGLRPPVSEEALGLGALGGSPAFDVYLVDFDGVGDGHFTLDGCTPAPVTCGGALVVENDFVGYGYPSPSYGLRLVIMHEIFHGVQAAYGANLPVWLSEGSAVWGAARYGGPGHDDLLRFSGAYLAEAYRTLYKPPGGPVPAFAYGTALWFDFLALRHDTALVRELLEVAGAAADEHALLDGMVAVLEARGDTLEEAWPEFASWNLATGIRSGLMDSYPYASKLRGLQTETTGPEVDDDSRHFPLGARYYLLKHGGGPLWFGLEEVAEGLWFAVHPVDGDTMRVADALERWEGIDASARPLQGGANLSAGRYWLVVSNARHTGSSSKVRVCLGTEEVAGRCVAAEPEPGPEPEPRPEPEPQPEPAPAPEAELGDDLGVVASFDAGGSDLVGGAAEPVVPGGGAGDAGCAQGSGSCGPSGLLALAGLTVFALIRRRRVRVA